MIDGIWGTGKSMLATLAALKLLNEGLRAAYEQLRENSDLGSRYEQDGITALRFLTETKHWLYYIVQTLPTGKQRILIIGIQGPGTEGALL